MNSSSLQTKSRPMPSLKPRKKLSCMRLLGEWDGSCSDARSADIGGVQWNKMPPATGILFRHRRRCTGTGAMLSAGTAACCLISRCWMKWTANERSLARQPGERRFPMQKIFQSDRFPGWYIQWDVDDRRYTFGPYSEQDCHEILAQGNASNDEVVFEVMEEAVYVTIMKLECLTTLTLKVS